MIFQNKKNAFLGYKNKNIKISKKCHFSKVVNPRFWFKNGRFFQFLSFGHYRPGQSLLRYSRKKKTLFQAIKTRCSKRRKSDIFSKGLIHGFLPKMAIFPTFFFQVIQARKMSFMIFSNKKTPFQAIKTRSSNSRKIDIFPKGLTHGFGPKMAIFPTFFFQAIQARKMSFIIFQNEKTPFQAIKTRSPKIDIFPKRLTHGFGPKMAILPFFFLSNIGQGNILNDILEGKNACLGYKKKKSKKSKN